MERSVEMPSKLQELILYVAKMSLNDESFGYIKLNKILFYADFFAYGELGESITGATYIRNHFGPTPKEILPAQAALEDAGRAQLSERLYFGHTQRRLVPIDEPNMSMFTTEEIGIVDRVLNECKYLSGTQLSDLTHQLRPWLNSAEGEEIPYYTVFTLKSIPVGYEDRLWAENALDELAEMDPADLEPIEVDA